MQLVRISAYQVGLVLKNGVYEKVLTTGLYWIRGARKIYVYDLQQQFLAPVPVDMLLQNEELTRLLDVVIVKESELALIYENDLLVNVLTPGRYLWWKSVINRAYRLVDISRVEIPAWLDRNQLANPMLEPFVRKTEVPAHVKALLFLDNRFEQMLEPGIYYWWMNDVKITTLVADLRLQQMEVTGQEILTRDKAALRVNAWAQYRLTDPLKALQDTKDLERQLHVLVQLAIREAIGTLSFDELLERKEDRIAAAMDRLKSESERLGVEMVSMGIRDIILPGDVKEIMNQVLMAEKKAQANAITRREETASTRSLLNTAKLMEENAMLWKLKEMEYVENVMEKVGTININGNGLLLEQLKQMLTS